jgi:ABC-type polar amino acid transport system ATPase subunit
VLFDEPTSALDSTMVSEILAVIRKLVLGGMCRFYMECGMVQPLFFLKKM